MTVEATPPTWLGGVLLHDEAGALEQALQAVHPRDQPFPVLHAGQLRQGVSLRRHAVAEHKVVAVQRAHVHVDRVVLPQAAHQVRTAADAAAVHQDADGGSGGGGTVGGGGDGGCGGGDGVGGGSGGCGRGKQGGLFRR